MKPVYLNNDKTREVGCIGVTTTGIQIFYNKSIDTRWPIKNICPVYDNKGNILYWSINTTR